MTAVGSDRLRKLLEEFRNRFDVPALCAAFVARDGTLKLEAVGKRQRGSADLVTLDDQWHIGSCGKAITAALYARLVERGDTDWGIPISEFFPDLADNLDAGWTAPTIDEVLVCRAGMMSNLSRSESLSSYEDPSAGPEQRTTAAMCALSQPPKRRGTFRYSNVGYIVAGAAIDRITKMPFEEALRTHLLQPLGITSAGVGPPPDIWGHRARFHMGGLGFGKGSPAPPESIRSDNPPVLTPAGRLHLTMTDWAKFQTLFLNHGGHFLRPGTIEHLLALPAGKGNGMAMGWAPTTHLDSASYGMQGSNTMWVATAIIDTDFERTAMVITNDGRSRLLKRTAQLATQILTQS